MIEMKQGCDVKRLGDICDTSSGGTPLKAHKDYYEGGEIPWLMSGEVSQGEVFEAKNFITEKGLKNSSAKMFPVNTVLIAMYGATAGQVGILKFEACSNQAVCGILPNSKTIPEYIYYCFLSKKEELVSQAVGGAQPNISQIKIRNTKIPLPTLTEQNRIVSILDKSFTAIDKAKANAEQNLKNTKELFESYLQSIFENKVDNWEKKSLGEVLQKTESIDPTKKPEEEFIYLDVSSVNKETKEIENSTKLIGKDAPSRARKLIRTNDVIFATVRPTHSRVAIITKEYNGQVCSTGYFVLRSKDFLNNNLIFYFLLTYRFNKEMEKLQKGASYPAVTDSEVKSIIISYPKSLEEQQKIVSKLDLLSDETKKLEAIYKKKIEDLDELKKSVLQKAFSGELTTSKELISV